MYICFRHSAGCPTSSLHTLSAGSITIDIYARDVWGNAAPGEVGVCPFVVSAVSAAIVRAGQARDNGEIAAHNGDVACSGGGGGGLVDVVGARKSVSAYVSVAIVQALTLAELHVNVTERGASEGGHVMGSPMALVTAPAEVCASASSAFIVGQEEDSPSGLAVMTVGVGLIFGEYKYTMK